MQFRHLLLAALALAVLAPTALAQDLTADRSAEMTADEVPARFTYSGLLTTADGMAVADGPRALVFRGYASAEDARTGASPTWEESHEAAVVGGRFLTVLGSRDDVPLGVRYMTVSVDGEAASAPVRLDRGATADAEFAPGNTLQDSYLNGRTITTGGSASAVQIQGPANTIGLTVRDVTAVFTTDQLTRFRLTSTSGGGSPGSAQIWEYRVYGSNNVDPGPGVFSVADATGGGSDGLTLHPGVSENLLNLIGTTVNVGSPNAPRDFRAYTTANPADPANGFVSFRAYDYFGFGASSNWLTEDGQQHTRIEPDVNGDGGFFTVSSGTGAIAFTVDGNVSGGSQTRVGSGANSSFFDNTVAGDGSVLLPSSAISSTEILNEAGAANAFNGSPVTIAAGFNATLVRSITVPSAGYVIAMGVGELTANHSAGSTDTFQFSVSRDCGTPTAPTSQQANWQVPAALPTATYRDIASAQGLFTVAAGTTQFCNVVTGPAGSSIDDQNLTLLFVPTAYGAIQTNLVEGGSEERQEAATSALSSGDIASERAASVQANEARVAAELTAILERVAELEASMSNNER